MTQPHAGLDGNVRKQGWHNLNPLLQTMDEPICNLSNANRRSALTCHCCLQTYLALLLNGCAQTFLVPLNKANSSHCQWQLTSSNPISRSQWS